MRLPARAVGDEHRQCHEPLDKFFTVAPFGQVLAVNVLAEVHQAVQLRLVAD